ncbi:SMP-30/gluconolactonase/LRE family protein [Sphingomonas montana]|uniref:SMP-30/gluconolactonase/LRE family protein n=1 Tax=Sphingomonas montana TaxID=1843236 RepID=UPI00096BD18C|nr:SMP-30/gluconolactonase/LRE family protein [Sphingomonas montana]
MAEYRIVPRVTGDILGEGPLWSASRQRLFWVDIMGQRLWSLSLDDDRIESWAMPERIGWVVERGSDGRLLAGFKSGIVALSLDPISTERLYEPERDRPDNRLNDAKVDSAGRLWFGSKDDRDRNASGALYRLDPGGMPIRVDDGYRVTNGPAFSPDGRVLYHTDSGLGLVYRFAVAADGQLGEREIFLRFEPGWGSPDGMTSDREGCLWIAHWGGGRVTRFDPSGRPMRSIMLPTTNITSCAFAGKGMDRLFVTSSRIDADGEAHAGALFEVDARVIGGPTYSFGG